VGSGHKWFLGENPPSFTCILPVHKFRRRVPSHWPEFLEK
jgi:hypothetical protein